MRAVFVSTAVVIALLLWWSWDRVPGAQPDVAGAPPAYEVSAEPGGQLHVIAEGDTLESISIQYYGSPDHVDALRAANPEFALTPGTALRIPKLPTD